MEILLSKENYTSRVDQIADFLIQGIRGGLFVPGQRLIESDLTEELGISRGPLREAFRLVAEKGLIDLIPNRGAIVKKFTLADIIQRFHLIDQLGSMCLQQINSEQIDKSRLEIIVNSHDRENGNILSQAIDLYYYLAKTSNNILLADIIIFLNITHFSRYIINLIKLDTITSREYFLEIYRAILNDSPDYALKAHATWSQDLLRHCE